MSTMHAMRAVRARRGGGGGGEEEEERKLKDYAIGRFWLISLVDQKIPVAFSNPFYVVFWPISAPMPSFNRII